jgi:VWFA-related protein
MRWRVSTLILALVATLSTVIGGQQPKPAAPEPQPKPEPGQQQPPAPVFRTEANFVRVDAYPTKDGKPLHGLTVDDFEVFEDGVRQKVDSFEHVIITPGTPPDARIEPNSPREGERMAGNPRNRVFVVFLDVAHVDVSGSHAIQEPLIRLMNRMMGPDDLVAVMTPAMSPTQVTFGRRTDVIERGLRENWPWGTRHSLIPMDDVEVNYEQCYPPKTGERSPSALAREMMDRRRERMVLEALHDLVVYLGGVREERKAIITVSDGWRLYRPNEAIMHRRKDPMTGTEDPMPGVEPIGVGPDGRLRRNPRAADLGGSSQYQCDTDRLALGDQPGHAQAAS